MKLKKLLLVISVSCFLLLGAVNCQEGGGGGEEEQETTTEPYIESTTTEAPFVVPPNLQHFDYRFVSLTDDFVIDVNVTEIEGNAEETEMSIYVKSGPNSTFAQSVCDGKTSLVAVQGEACPPGIATATTVTGDVIAHIDKAAGSNRTTVKFNIPYFYSHNCIIVASVVRDITNETAETSTELPSDDDGEGNTENPIETAAVVLEEPKRKKRQSEDADDDDADSANLEDFYDPEDATGSDEDVRSDDINEDDYVQYDDDLIAYRNSTCKNRDLGSGISVIRPARLAQTRGLLLLAAVYGSGSVSRPVSVVSSGSVVAVNFGSAGSFTFNPLANWPLVVLQGNAVLATYGAIIVWALILGAIIWAIAVGAFSGAFSAERVGYIETNMIYGPLQRINELVHNGIARISDLNRRNAWNIQNTAADYQKSYNGYQHRSSAYDDDVSPEYVDNGDNVDNGEYSDDVASNAGYYRSEPSSSSWSSWWPW